MPRHVAAASLAAAILMAGCSGGPPSAQTGGSGTDTVGAASLQYTPGTVVVGGQDARAAVLSIAPDGRQITLDPHADGVARLQAGSVLLLPRVAMRRVLGIHPDARGVVVDTGDAALTDAVQSGTIEFSSRVSFATAKQVGLVPASPAPTTSPAATAAEVAAPESLQLMASGPQPVSPSPATLKPIPSPCHPETSGAWTYTVCYTLGAGGLSMSMTGARSGSDVAGIKATGTLDDFHVGGTITVKGCVTHFSVQLDGIHGQSTIDWKSGSAGAVFAEKSTFTPQTDIGVDIGNVGPLPLSLRVSGALLANPALTGRHSTLSGSATADISGSTSYTVDNGAISMDGKLDATPHLTGASGVGVGPSGAVAALKFPLIGLAIGEPQIASTQQAVSVVLSLGIVETGAVSVLLTSCRDATAIAAQLVQQMLSGSDGVSAATASVRGAPDRQEQLTPSNNACAKAFHAPTAPAGGSGQAPAPGRTHQGGEQCQDSRDLPAHLPDTYPFQGPDGTTIARRPDGQIVVTTRDGGELFAIPLSTREFLAVLPDGSQLTIDVGDNGDTRQDNRRSGGVQLQDASGVTDSWDATGHFTGSEPSDNTPDAPNPQLDQDVTVPLTSGGYRIDHPNGTSEVHMLDGTVVYVDNDQQHWVDSNGNSAGASRVDNADGSSDFTFPNGLIAHVTHPVDSRGHPTGGLVVVWSDTAS